MRDVRDRLRADCGSCFGLCCVALPFAASADFAIDKPAGQPCPNLRPDFGCGIHDRLREKGFPGCTVYDCFGAGQQVAQVTFQGRDWRRHPETAQQMYGVFAVMRHLHELLWYLSEALTLQPALYDDLQNAYNEIKRLTGLEAEALEKVDVDPHRLRVAGLLRQTSEHVRGGVPNRKDHSEADLIGANLMGADLRGASLRSAYVIGANLRGADLRLADLLGADVRNTDLRDADLTGAIFLTQPQLTAAKGNDATRIPAALIRPPHWTS
jgi:uncharacterized protein YjbI with pentapeptide repeats